MRRRIGAAAFITVLLAIAAFVSWRGLGGPGAGGSERSDHAASRVALAPTPSPTPPPPWLGSVAAFVVPDGDGRAIAVLAVPDGGQPRRLVGGFADIGALAWSRDGTQLAFAASAGGNWDLYRVGLDGGAPMRVTHHPAYDGWPSWSPDGRHLAFSSYRDGNLDVYVTEVDEAAWPGAGRDGGTEGSVVRVTAGSDPAIEPAWSPDGTRIAYASWLEGAYGLAVAPAPGEGPDARQETATIDASPLVEGDSRVDLRAPRWAPDGRGIAYVEWRNGPGVLTWQPAAVREVGQVGQVGDAAGERRDTTEETDAGVAARPPMAAAHAAIASDVRAFDWYPDGGAVLVLAEERGGTRLEVADLSGHGRHPVASLPADTAAIAWSRGPVPDGLPPLQIEQTSASADAGGPSAPSWETGERVAVAGFAALSDVRVPGARIHADLADDFAAMRAEVRAAVGSDFLGTLSDLWRPLGYVGSSFFSWHKLGRAFDTQMELRGPGGRRDMVLVREENRGRTRWRMYLRASPQDGSVGVPLLEPGWTFAAGSGDVELAQEGGRRGARVPGGYWLDFTAVAARYGWQRIPSITRGDLDWRRNWTGIDYWHYERRDGLRWFDAARQVYSDEDLSAELRSERLRERGVSLSRLTWLGFPDDWLEGS